MKTFKQHIKEEGEGIGTTLQPKAVEDGSIGVHNVHDPDVLKRVNAFVQSISMKEYIDPHHAINELRSKLMRIGLNFGPVVFNEDESNQTVSLKRFKTFGQADDGNHIDNDGISDVKEGGLKLEVEHGKTSSGTSKVYAKLI